MNNKGFSLVELLAVLIVLVLIGLVAVPAVLKLLDESRTDLYDTQINSIVEGAKNWVADNPRSLPQSDGEEVFVSLGQLKIGSYVDVNITDTITDKLYDTRTKIIIKKENGKYKYDVVVNNDKSGEEEKGTDVYYPSIEYNGDLVVYLNVNDTYEEDGINVDNELCSQNDCYNSNYYISFNLDNIDTSTRGNYYAEYIVTNRQTGRDLALFRTVIVK